MTRDLATQAGNGKAVAKKVDPINAMMAKMSTEIARGLPEHLSPDRFARVVTTAVKSNPKLMQCAPVSLVSSIMLAAQLGLEPGTFGHCYLIPYNSRNGLQCQFQIGYRGLLELIRRSGQVVSIGAEPVHERDQFEMTLGVSPDIRHVPYLDGDRGAVRLVYAWARLKDEGVQFAWMSWPEIMDHKQKYSKAKDSPWDSEPIEMAKKTVLIRLSKLLPLSVDLMRGVSQDGKIKSNLAEDMTLDQENEDIAFREARDVTADSTGANDDPAPAEGGEPGA